MSGEDIQISYKNQVLTLSGERTSSHSEIKNENRFVIERSVGKFTRAVRLPDDADSDKVVARMDHGVLELAIAKKPSDGGFKKIIAQ
ncbi:hypothetical protein HDU98_009337 [Podochytrium sp. JEL0797]|nr:hypothetical protein HDU98_009337 [Podochytrium sp. JEL0797]